MNGQQLRDSILQLAIQGRLVSQDASDEPAEVLLGRIRKEKARLVKEGKLKKKDLECAAVGDDEKAFELPEGWCWCRFSTICNLLSGRDLEPQKYNSLNKGIPYMTGASNFNEGNLIVNRWTESPMTISNYGDLLITCKGTIGEMAFNKIGDIHIARQIMAVSSPYVNLSYIQYFLESKVFELVKIAKSIIPGFTRDDLLNTAIPLPPLSEQRRIVSKIEELLPLVSEYDSAQRKLDGLNGSLRGALKKSILQEAIMGRLVAQDSSDEPADALLGRIRKEKARLVKEGKLKKKDLECAAVGDDEKAFELPEGWCWCRVADICNFANPDKRVGKYVCLDAKYLRGKSEGTVLEKGNYVEANSHIILVDGENSGEIFSTPCCGYMGSTFKELIINSQPCESYILLFLLQLKETLRNNKRGSAIPHLDKDLFFQTVIPLPPLSEQRRIVARIEELFRELE